MTTLLIVFWDSLGLLNQWRSWITAGFQELLTSIKKRDNKETAPVDVQKEDIYFPEFYSYGVTFHVGSFIVTHAKGSDLQNLLTPKDKLINEATPQKISLFSKNIFKPIFINFFWKH